MSRARMQALRPLIDARVADYIDAAIAVALADQANQNRMTSELLAGHVNAQETRLQALEETARVHGEHLDTAQYEDRFALTKAKMIRAFKEMGIK